MQARGWTTALVLALGIAALPCGARAVARSPGDPLAFVQARYTDLLAMVKKYPEKERMQQALRGVMETFVDYRELSRRTLVGEWDKLKRRDQDAFVAQFKQMIQRSYVRHFDAGVQFTIDYTGDVRTDPDGSVTVPSVIHSGRSEAKVEYVLYAPSGKWLAYDVVIDDVSMVRNYRKQFHDIMAKEGFPGLMDRLRKKNAAAQE